MNGFYSDNLQVDPGEYGYYLIDSSGYVVLYTDCSNDESNDEVDRVGQFFGVIENNGYVMQCFLDATVFQNVNVYNYQALCPTSMLKTKSAWSLQTVIIIVTCTYSKCLKYILSYRLQ